MPFNLVNAAAAAVGLLALVGGAGAQGALPACAQTGSPTLTVDGRPALRLSDVAACPPSMIEIVPGFTVDGQPLVHLRSDPATGCAAAAGNPAVDLGGRPAQTAGDVTCPPP